MKTPMGPKPEIGDEIYFPTLCSIDHGEDDICGGLGEICAVAVLISAGKPTYFVRIKELAGDCDRSLNYTYLLERQQELKAEFGTERARPDPDYG